MTAGARGELDHRIISKGLLSGQVRHQEVLMKRFSVLSSLILAVAVVGLVAVDTASAAGLRRSRTSCDSCCAEPGCAAAEPGCAAAEPACCAAEPACGAAPACCSSEPRRRTRRGLFSRRGKECCTSCAEPGCAAEPGCGAEPACGACAK